LNGKKIVLKCLFGFSNLRRVSFFLRHFRQKAGVVVDLLGKGKSFSVKFGNNVSERKKKFYDISVASKEKRKGRLYLF